MTQRDIAKDKEMCEAASGKSWYWHGFAKQNSVTLYTHQDGHQVVMDFVRWGMSGAAPSFNTADGMQRIDEDGLIEFRQSHRKNEFYKINHPDARFIAESREALPYWIAQYELTEQELRKYHRLHDRGYEEHLNLMRQYEAAQARISELEALLHPNNRPDVRSISSHDRALETVFRELGDAHG